MDWYSIRLRAAAGGPHEKGGRHISGAEDLVPETEIEDRLFYFWQKASNHEKGKWDFLQITVEKIDERVQEVSLLPVKLFYPATTVDARKLATELLGRNGITQRQINSAFQLLENPPQDIRGAWVVALDSNRVVRENVRATKFGWNKTTYQQLQEMLTCAGLINTRLSEALALASKVNACSGIVAELCWSDNPEYTTGYVASSRLGYCRLPNFKPIGKGGGRVFWIEKEEQIESVLHWLREVPCLIGGVPILQKEE